MKLPHHKFLDIDYPSTGAKWIHPISARLHKSEDGRIKERLARVDETSLSELSLSLYTKLNMVHRVVGRLVELLRELTSLLNKDLEKVSECLRTGTVFTVPKEDFSNDLLIELDAFIFETRSCYEIVGKYIKEFFNHYLEETINEDDLKNMLKDEGLDNEWIDVMTETRIFFFHRSAPWYALKIISCSPLEWELIILKELATGPTTDETDYIELKKYQDIFSGFRGSFTLLQTWLIQRIDDYEKKNFAPPV